jgi:hypothetical protein
LKRDGWRNNFRKSEYFKFDHRIFNGDGHADAADFGDRFFSAFDFHAARARR